MTQLFQTLVLIVSHVNSGHIVWIRVLTFDDNIKSDRTGVNANLDKNSLQTFKKKMSKVMFLGFLKKLYYIIFR